MHNPPVEFLPSTSVASSLSDVVTSYRRAQTFLSGSNITSSNAFPEGWARRDEETGLDHENDDPYETPVASENGARTPHSNNFLDPLWDDAMQAFPNSVTRPITNEQTPLLLAQQGAFHDSTIHSGHLQHNRMQIPRHVSTRIDVKYHSRGNSTSGQTLFNSVAILLGIGMLSEPLAFACAGWGAGTLLICFYGFITCYTAKILGHFILSDPSLITYADIGHKAFGQKSVILTSVLFCLELFAMSVVLVTLYADSLHLVVPVFSLNQYKVFGLLVLIPTILMPLSVLSYASILGILSTVLLMACIFIDGFSKHEGPGSLWQPATTRWGAQSPGKLGVAFGLFMAGFGGHVVIPSLARDMIDPSQFDTVMNLAFAVATVLYGIIGAAGYLMFGISVSEEISQDILATPGYNVVLNKLAVWMLVIAPLSKFALATRPLNLTVEIWLGIDKPAKPDSPSCPTSPITRSAATLATSLRTTPRPWLLGVERVTLAILAVTVSILVPEFSTVMAFLGSFSAFMLCVIGPVCAKIALQRRCEWYDAALLLISLVMAVWGTYAAFA